MEINIEEMAEQEAKREKRAFEIAKKYWGVIPGGLLLESTISNPAKILYGLYHLRCRKKKFCEIKNGNCQTYISQLTIAKQLGCAPVSVKRWHKELLLSGWISVGPKRSRYGTNIVTLNAKPKPVIKSEEVSDEKPN